MDARKISALVNIAILLFIILALGAMDKEQYLLTGVCVFSIVVFHALREAFLNALLRHDEEHEQCIKRGVRGAMRSIRAGDKPEAKRYIQ
jgi:hypothetical protein